MITLVNSRREVQDIKPYRARIYIPQTKISEIESFIKQRETELNGCKPFIAEDESRWYPKNFGKLTENFLRDRSYAENLLPSLPTLSETTVLQIYDYWDSWLGGDINRTMYYLEKIVRLGFDKLALKGEEPFQNHWKERIFALEDELYDRTKEICEFDTKTLNSVNWDNRSGPKLLIKMLGRHETLGLPVENEQKEKLQDILQRAPWIMYYYWVACSAKRLGLTLPPYSSEHVDCQIKAWIEHDEKELKGGLLEFNIRTEKPEKDIFFFYLAALHHLHRLLD